MSSGVVVQSGHSEEVSPRSFWRFSPAPNPKLRVGLLLDSTNVSRFFASIIEDIQASNFAELELLIFRKRPVQSKAVNQRHSVVTQIKRRLTNPSSRKHALYDLYLRLDQRKKAANHPLDVVDCSHLLQGVEKIEVEPIGKKYVHRFPREAMKVIEAKNLDVLIRFGFNILHGDILNAAKYGVWSYHHGDNEFYRGGPPHLWELWEDAPLSGVILQVLTEELDAGLVLCKSLFATENTVSLSRNRYPAYWGSSHFVIRKLHELHRFGWDYLRERALPPASYQGKKKIYRTPTNVEMVRWLAPMACRKLVQRLVRRKKVQHWRIAMRSTGQHLFAQDAQADLSGFRWLEPPRGYFWADPFVIEHNSKNWMFFEEYSYRERRAHICCAEILPNGSLGESMRCLADQRHHFSYPYVFRVDDTIYMVPESVDGHSVDLYRCEEFPDKWVKDTTLLRGRFVDSTIWQHENLWWLMTTSAEPDSRSGSLLLFYSDSLHGSWQFHPANPISTDVRNIRGAGRVFTADSRLIRPSQNCCGVYGRNLAFYEITALSKRNYAERRLKTLDADSVDGICGLHTYNWSGNIEVIDGQQSLSLKSLLSKA